MLLWGSSAKALTNGSIICIVCWGGGWGPALLCSVLYNQSTEYCLLQQRVSSLKILWLTFGCKLVCGNIFPLGKGCSSGIGKMWVLHWSTLIPMTFQRQNIESIWNQNGFKFFLLFWLLSAPFPTCFQFYIRILILFCCISIYDPVLQNETKPQ